MNSNIQETRRSGRQTKKSFKIRENDALAPILLEALPPESQHLVDNGIPQFEPQQRLPFEPMTVKVPIKSPLQLFLLLLGESTLQSIVKATNAYALYAMEEEIRNFERPRPWHPITRNELIVWLGTLFFMGRHYEFNREYHWHSGTLKIGRLGKVMSKTRWEQIHRFFKISLKSERTPGQPWWYKVDPMLTIVRQNIKNAVFPANWLAVDELMIPFQGRTKHSIKIRGKPIKEGFKMWCLGFKGYIWTFSFHSGDEDDEGIPLSRMAVQPDPLEPVHLAPTHQVPLFLCEQIRASYPTQHCLVFLDNLFLNVNVAHCLFAIGFSVMGTTRKNAAGLPASLTAVLAKDKKAKKDAQEEAQSRKLQLAYNSVMAVVIHKCLCFLWQDNNTVLAITTAHSLHRPQDRIERQRTRPKSTSTNAKQAYSCFEGKVKKWLAIPVPIDDYNHSMNGVDTASQIQRGFSIHRPSEVRWWRPIFYWIVDICQNNAYLIWKTTQTHIKGKKHHQHFIDTLIEEMLGYDPDTPSPEAEHQTERHRGKRQCAYGARNKGGCAQVDDKKRVPLGEVSGNARVTTRPREVRTGCKCCGVNLCIDRPCFQRYHASITSR